MRRPATIDMREEDWASLVYSIQEGNCILMLGPDALDVSYDGEVVPVLTGLARFVKERLGPAYAHLDASKPAAIAQVAVHTEDPNILQQWVRSFYESAEPTSSVLEDLASLPFPLVINTSPVVDIGAAFLQSKPETTIDFYDHSSRSRPEPPDPSQNAPLIYNLYGSLDRPDSIIISEFDRLEFLVSIITDNPQVPKKIRSALRDDRTSFLFVGFNLHQWQLRLLLHVLAKTHRRLKSFALELDPTKVDVETALFYEHGHRIQFPDMTLADFTSELCQRVGPVDSGLHVDAGANESPAPGAPSVFLCHASEDKAHAERIRLGLRRNGIDGWLDKHDLRGGDRWDEAIREAIRNEVDYVVIVQSSTLAQRTVGYVNREIRLALDRQQEYRAPRRFIIPVSVDGSVGLQELADIQSIDLATEEGIDDLVKAINRDVSLLRRES